VGALDVELYEGVWEKVIRGEKDGGEDGMRKRADGGGRAV